MRRGVYALPPFPPGADRPNLSAGNLARQPIDPLDSEVQPSPEYLNATVTAAHPRPLPVEYRQALSALVVASSDWL
jgi:hypothetical protein